METFSQCHVPVHTNNEIYMLYKNKDLWHFSKERIYYIAKYIDIDVWNAHHRFLRFLGKRKKAKPTQYPYTNKCTANRFHDSFVPFFLCEVTRWMTPPRKRYLSAFCRAAKSPAFPLLLDCRTRSQWKASYPRDPSRQSSSP